MLFLIFIGVANNINLKDASFLLFSVVSLFICVILHEFGHAIAARRYGVITKDIIISPIGGVARLETMPEEPLEEFKIAAAGPLVNVGLAIIFLALFSITYQENPLAYLFSMDSVSGWKNFLRFLLQINIALFLFNLIPAFPMDGGRILRSLMSLRYGKIYSTKVSTVIGKLLASVFVIIGFYYSHPILAVIGIVVYFMARKEFQLIRLEEKLHRTSLAEIMRDKFARIKITDPMSLIFEISNQGKERSFIVFDHLNNAVGILHQYFIEEARKNNAFLEPVSFYTSGKIYFLSPHDSIDKAKNLMQKEGLSIIGIKTGDQLSGVVDRQDILQFIDSY